MKKIYKAPMRTIYITNLEINAGNIKVLEFDTPIVRKDLMFYINRFGNFISFEHGTRLPDFHEAYDFVTAAALRREDSTPPYPSCSFIKDGEYEFSHEIDDRNFRALKKYYNDLRKEEERNKKRRGR